MRILELNIQAFGGLRNFSWQPDQGFSLLYGPNESGKSTILAFVRAMFYGLGRRSQNLEKNARQLYQPWHHAGEMGGSLTFELQGQTYRLERKFGRVRSEDQVTLYNQSLYQNVDLAHPDQPGLDLLKLSEDNFTLACLVAQPQEAANPQALNQVILQLQATGSEDQATSLLGDQLQKEARILGAGSQGGLLGEALAQVETLEQELEAAVNRDQAIQASRGRNKLLEDRLAVTEAGLTYYQLESDLALLRAHMQPWSDYQKRKAAQLDQAKAQLPPDQQKLKALPARELGLLGQKADQLARLSQELQQTGDNLRQAEEDIRQLSLQLHQARQASSQADHKQQCLQAKIQELGLDQIPSQRPPSWSLLVLAAGLGLSLVIIFILSVFTKIPVLGIGLGLVGASLVIFALVRFSEQGRLQDYQAALARRHRYMEASQAAKEKSNRAAWYLERIEEDLAKKEGERQARFHMYQTALRRYEAARQDFRLTLKPWYPELGDQDPLAAWDKVKNFSLSAQVRALEAESLEPYSPEDLRQMQADYEAAQKEVQRTEKALTDLLTAWPQLAQGPDQDRAELRAAAQVLREQLADQKAELASLEVQGKDTANLEAALTEARQDLAQKDQEYRVVKLAQAILTRALKDYQLQFQPQLQTKSQAWLRELTQGRYQEVQVSAEGDLALVSSQDGHYHEDAYYSTGTRDLVYLSLRLALADMLAEAKNLNLPLFLDDSLSSLDQDRWENALTALTNYAQNTGRQIILCTASHNMRQIAESRGLKVLELTRLT